MTKLPDGWTRCTIGSLCELINGRAFKPTDWSDTGLPIVRIQNLNNSHAKFNRFDGEVRSRFLIDSGALLFAWSGTPGTSFGAHIWSGGKAVLNQHIFNVLFDEEAIDKQFLRLAINQKLDELIDRAHGGVGLRHVTKGMFEGTKIDLPPLHTQRRIAAKLDSLREHSNCTRRNLNGIRRLVDRYKQAILSAAFRGALTADWRTQYPEESFSSMAVENHQVRTGLKKRDASIVAGFTAPFGLPPSWTWVPLPQLGTLDRGKSRHRPRNAPHLYDGPYPFIQTGDVRAAQGRLTTFVQTYSEAGLLQSRLWPTGTLCITIAANIAETAILGFDACFPDSIVGFIANQKICNAHFVEFFIRTVKADLAEFAPATAQKNINLETLRIVRVPCAPLREQNVLVERIEAAFSRIEAVAREASRAAALLDRLDQATLAKAFRGELVPEDPSDVPIPIATKDTHTEMLGRPALRLQLASVSKRSKTTDTTKGGVVAKKRTDVNENYLTESLRALGGSADANSLWQSSGMEIDEFYKQLRDEIKAGHIEEGASKERLRVTNAA